MKAVLEAKDAEAQSTVASNADMATNQVPKFLYALNSSEGAVGAWNGVAPTLLEADDHVPTLTVPR